MTIQPLSPSRSVIRRERGWWIYQHLPSRVGRLLDVGCHTALDTASWASKAEALFGIDIAPEIVGGHPTVLLAQANAAQLPFVSGSFDVVTFSEVLEHLPPDLERPALEEIRRVLTDDGLLLLTTPHRGWFAWLDPLDMKRRLHVRPGKGHRHYTVSEVTALLDGLFHIVELERNSLVLHPISTWLGVGNQSRWERLRSKMSDWDYNHQFGPAAFNLALVATPI